MNPKELNDELQRIVTKMPIESIRRASEGSQLQIAILMQILEMLNYQTQLIRLMSGIDNEKKEKETNAPSQVEGNKE